MIPAISSGTIQELLEKLKIIRELQKENSELRTHIELLEKQQQTASPIDPFQHAFCFINLEGEEK